MSVTRHPQADQEEIRFIYENVNETILHLREEKGKDIWLFGGGEIITMLLNQDLVDEMIITYIPVILGNGIPLFPNNPKESHWALSKTECFEQIKEELADIIGFVDPRIEHKGSTSVEGLSAKPIKGMDLTISDKVITPGVRNQEYMGLNFHSENMDLS